MCRSVSLHGLIARQRTAHVPVRCLTTFASASELHDCPGCSVCLGGCWVLLVPNFLQLRCCRSVFESLQWSGGGCLVFTPPAVRPSWGAWSSIKLVQVASSQGGETSHRQSRETEELRALINPHVKLFNWTQNSVFTLSFKGVLSRGMTEGLIVFLFLGWILIKC